METSRSIDAHLSPAGHELLSPAEPWWKNSYMVTFAFRCNIACSFCMVEDVLNVLPGASLDDLRRLAADPQKLAGVRRIIFTGGEVTLAKELVDYARLARSIPGIEHVRLQTNATRLGDRAYLETLLGAGVDELFVSLHAPTAPLYDELVRRAGSFEAIVAGMRAIAESGATLITNTAIVAPNYALLKDIVALALPYRPRSMEFWNYWPRADEDGGRGLAAPVGAIRPHLIAAVEACLAAGIPPVIKWFPRCLLGPHARYQDDGQPPALIDDRYWDREPPYACIYEGVCADAGKDCSGLSESYIRHFGWEEELLRPRREDGRRTANSTSPLTRSLVKDAGPKRTDTAKAATWLAGFQVRLGDTLAGWTLTEAAPGHGQTMVALVFERGAGGPRLEVRVLPIDESRRCYARTRSFDVMYSRVDERLSREAAAVTQAFVARLAAIDGGGLALPT